MDTTILDRRPVLAVLSGGILLLGFGISLFGIALAVIGWLGVWTSHQMPLPASSIASIAGEQQMLNYAASILAVGGVPFMLVGMLLVAIVWLF